MSWSYVSDCVGRYTVGLIWNFLSIFFFYRDDSCLNSMYRCVSVFYNGESMGNLFQERPEARHSDELIHLCESNAMILLWARKIMLQVYHRPLKEDERETLSSIFLNSFPQPHSNVIAPMSRITLLGENHQSIHPSSIPAIPPALRVTRVCWSLSELSLGQRLGDTLDQWPVHCRPT